MKNYLRVYVKHIQNDWVDYLSEAKFAVNNHVNVFTEMTSFFADHDYHSRSGIEPLILYDNGIVKRAKLLSADQIAARQEAMRKWLVDNLTWAQIDQTKYVNNSRAPHPDYKIDDWIYVNTKDFSIEKQSRFLSSKNVGSWKIIRCIDNKAYELNISEHLKQTSLTTIFHSWELHLTPFNPFSEQVIQSGPSLLIQDDFETTSHEEYEMLEIVDCRDTKRYNIQYKTIYIESWDDWNANPSWQPWSDFMNSREEVIRFHVRNKKKPAASIELISQWDRMRSRTIRKNAPPDSFRIKTIFDVRSRRLKRG